MSELIYSGASLDEEISIELFKIKKDIKCLPLLEAKLPTSTKILKKKRRDIKRAAKRLVRN